MLRFILSYLLTSTVTHATVINVDAYNLNKGVSDAAQKVSTLGATNMSGSSLSPLSASAVFNPTGTGQNGVFRFLVPISEVASLADLKISVNAYYSVPPSTQLWRFEIFNFATSSWVALGSNSGMAARSWNTRNFSAPSNPKGFVNALGVVRVRYRTASTASNKSYIDMIRIATMTGSTPVPAPTPMPAPAPGPGPIGSYQRPFGDKAPWNIPVAGIAVHPDSNLYRDKLWNESPSARPGNFNLGFEEYTYPVYLTTNATTTAKIVDTNRWVTGVQSLHGLTLPWNPAWRPAPGSDAQIILLDPVSGTEYDMWQVGSFNNGTVSISNGSRVLGDYRTKIDGNAPSRGIGIQYLAMLVRPEEIEAGVIRHALSMPIRNPHSRIFVAPATKLEGNGNTNGIPEGMRFALKVTDAEIEAWISAMPAAVPASTKRAARIIARALRDYGWFITDTAGGATFQFEANASAHAKWKALGLDERAPISAGGLEYPRDLLEGLLTRDRIYTLVPSDKY